MDISLKDKQAMFSWVYNSQGKGWSADGKERIIYHARIAYKANPFGFIDNLHQMSPWLTQDQREEILFSVI